jgi:hypothetical protein
VTRDFQHALLAQQADRKKGGGIAAPTPSLPKIRTLTDQFRVIRAFE